MHYLFSAGLIVFCIKREMREYLLLHYPHGHWDFAKGKIEKGESKHQAALRELKEETNLDAEIFSGFQEQMSYFFRQDNELIKKTVYYFIAKAQSDIVALSFEHIGYAWLSYKDALEQLTYDNAKIILEKAENFLQKNV